MISVSHYGTSLPGYCRLSGAVRVPGMSPATRRCAHGFGQKPYLKTQLDAHGPFPDIYIFGPCFRPDDRLSPLGVTPDFWDKYQHDIPSYRQLLFDASQTQQGPGLMLLHMASKSCKDPAIQHRVEELWLACLKELRSKAQDSCTLQAGMNGGFWLLGNYMRGMPFLYRAHEEALQAVQGSGKASQLEEGPIQLPSPGRSPAVISEGFHIPHGDDRPGFSTPAEYEVDVLPRLLALQRLRYCCAARAGFIPSPALGHLHALLLCVEEPSVKEALEKAYRHLCEEHRAWDVLLERLGAGLMSMGARVDCYAASTVALRWHTRWLCGEEVDRRADWLFQSLSSGSCVTSYITHHVVPTAGMSPLAGSANNAPVMMLHWLQVSVSAMGAPSIGQSVPSTEAVGDQGINGSPCASQVTTPRGSPGSAASWLASSCCSPSPKGSSSHCSSPPLTPPSASAGHNTPSAPSSPGSPAVITGNDSMMSPGPSLANAGKDSPGSLLASAGDDESVIVNNDSGDKTLTIDSTVGSASTKGGAVITREHMHKDKGRPRAIDKASGGLSGSTTNSSSRRPTAKNMPSPGSISSAGNLPHAQGSQPQAPRKNQRAQDKKKRDKKKKHGSIPRQQPDAAASPVAINTSSPAKFPGSSRTHLTPPAAHSAGRLPAAGANANTRGGGSPNTSNRPAPPPPAASAMRHPRGQPGARAVTYAAAVAACRSNAQKALPPRQ